MTTPLPSRLAACRKFRWMAGMLSLPSPGGQLRCAVRLDDDAAKWPHDLGICVPCTNDSATRGCLLTLVRDAWGDPHLHASPKAVSGGWQVRRRALPSERPRKGGRPGDHRGAGQDAWWYVATGATEVEALVLALECAP